MTNEPTNQEIMDLFPEHYEGYKPTAKPIAEIDEELGLEIVEKETIESKYGCPPLDPDNSFHQSLQRQFDERGHLSPKQVSCLTRPRDRY